MCFTTACLPLTDIMCVLNARRHGYSLINKHMSVFSVVHLRDEKIFDICILNILSVCYKERDIVQLWPILDEWMCGPLDAQVWYKSICPLVRQACRFKKNLSMCVYTAIQVTM